MIRLAADMGIFQVLSKSEQPVNDLTLARETGADVVLVCKYKSSRTPSSGLTSG